MFCSVLISSDRCSPRNVKALITIVYFILQWCMFLYFAKSGCCKILRQSKQQQSGPLIFWKIFVPRLNFLPSIQSWIFGPTLISHFAPPHIWAFFLLYNFYSSLLSRSFDCLFCLVRPFCQRRNQENPMDLYSGGVLPAGCSKMRKSDKILDNKREQTGRPLTFKFFAKFQSYVHWVCTNTHACTPNVPFWATCRKNTSVTSSCKKSKVTHIFQQSTFVENIVARLTYKLINK